LIDLLLNMKKNIPVYLLTENVPIAISSRNFKNRYPFLEKTLKKIAMTIKLMYLQSENTLGRRKINIHPQVMVFSFIYLIVVISLANNIKSQLTAFFFIVVFYHISKTSYKYVYKKIIFLSFVFGLLIFLPALLNVITPGKIVLRIFTFNSSFHFWIYNVPQIIGITDNGIHIVVLLFLRVLNSISLAMFFLYSSSFPQLIKGFKVFFIPDTFLMIISLAYKFIFILSKSIEESYFALKSRLAGNVRNKNVQNIISGRVFYIFKKAQSNYENTYAAMISKGYCGKVIFQNETKIKVVDLYFLLIMLVTGIIIIFI
jgi:cobalt/nickel transport system permease protein